MQRKRVLVIGLGRFGTAIVETLWANGAEVVVVDSDASAVEAVQDRSDHAFVGDGTKRKVLENVGAGDVDSAVVTFGEDLEASVLAVAELRDLLGEERPILARASTKQRAQVLRKVGASRVLQLEEEMGHRVATEILTPVDADLIEFASQYRVIPWTAAGPLIGKSIRACGLREKYHINVIGVRSAASGRGGKLAPPRPDYEIQPGDTLLIVGEEANVARFVGREGG